jgi:hypothetical protein
MKVTPVRAAFATCLAAGIAAAAVGLTSSTKVSSSSPVQKGIHPLVIVWVVDGSGALFHGSLGKLHVEGDSDRPEPFVETFMATGTLGDQRFKVICSGSFVDDHLVFKITGTMGSNALSGTAELTRKSNFSGTVLFKGTVGSTTISGSIPLSADTHGTLKGTVSVG